MKKRAGLARALVLDHRSCCSTSDWVSTPSVRLPERVTMDLNRQLLQRFIVVTHDIATARKVADYIACSTDATRALRPGAREMFESGHPPS